MASVRTAEEDLHTNSDMQRGATKVKTVAECNTCASAHLLQNYMALFVLQVCDKADLQTQPQLLAVPLLNWYTSATQHRQLTALLQVQKRDAMLQAGPSLHRLPSPSGSPPCLLPRREAVTYTPPPALPGQRAVPGPAAWPRHSVGGRLPLSARSKYERQTVSSV